MGRNTRDQLQFKSTFFTVDQVDLAPARAAIAERDRIDALRRVFKET